MSAQRRTAKDTPGPDDSGPAGAIAAEVLVIGGGMIGMTLACALANSGLAVALADAEKPESRLDPAHDGRSSAIAFGSQRILAGIGAWDAMAAEAEPIHDIRVSDGDGGGRVSPLFLHYDHQELSGRLAGTRAGAPPFGWIVENRAIRRALLARVAALPGITHLAPAQVLDLAHTPGGIVATLETGARIRAPLAVAAEGKNSPSRRAAGIPVTEWDYPQTGIVCTIGHELPHEGVAHEHFLPAGPFAVLPMTTTADGNRSSIVWTERAEIAPAMMALDDDAFAAEIMRRFGLSLGTIRVLGQRWTYPLKLMHAARYVDERLALIGDAAHVIHPIAGQGLNLGLRDVAALAEAIVDAARLGLDVGQADVLARYERWRRFDTMMLLAVTDSLNRLFSNDVALLRLARDMGLAAVDRLPPLKRLFMRHAMGLVGDLPRLVRGEPL
jgi:2-octaprenyl-6-methoxyphenol hydroxylase